MQKNRQVWNFLTFFYLIITLQKSFNCIVCIVVVCIVLFVLLLFVLLLFVLFVLLSFSFVLRTDINYLFASILYFHPFCRKLFIILSYPQDALLANSLYTFLVSNSVSLCC